LFRLSRAAMLRDVAAIDAALRKARVLAAGSVRQQQ
jgi:hypothetical protein